MSFTILSAMLQIFLRALTAALVVNLASPSTQPPPLRTFRSSSGEIDAAALSPDGRLLAISEREPLRWKGQLQIWDIEASKVVRSIRTPRSVHLICFSPDARMLAIGYDLGGLQIWNLRNGKLLHTLKGSHLARFSADNKVLSSVDINTKISGPGSIDLTHWDLQKGTVLKRVKFPLKSNHYTSDVALSPDMKLLALGVSRLTPGGPHSKKLLASEARLYDARSGQLKRVWHRASHSPQPGSEVESLCFSPDGKTVATGDSRGEILLRSTASNRVLGSIPAYKGGVHTLSYSPNGKMLLSQWNGLVKVWNSSNRTLLRSFPMKQSNNNTATFSSDSTQITGIEAENFRGIVRLWLIK
jgi:WD40 repeat protein